MNLDRFRLGSLRSAGFKYSFAFLMVLLAAPAGAADPRSDPSFAGARVSDHRETGRVRFVGTDPGRGVPLGYRPGQGRPEDFGLAIATEHGAAFGISNAAEQLRLSKTRTRPQGGHMLRYQQVHHGVPVFAGELIINLDHGKALQSMNGEISPDLDVSVTPTLTAGEAQQIALEAVTKWHKTDAANLETTTPELNIYDARLLKPSMLKPKLVWHIEVTSLDLLPVDELLLIDAHSGAINLHFNQIHAAKLRQTYDMGGTTAPLPGTLVCQEGDAFPGCAGGDQDVINAHAFAGDTYEFYASTHGRDGIDDAGSAMISSVHYDVDYPNAFWDGAQMVYGDGFADADDVVGHELTHGVTQYESNLLYYYQSGAINESFSDVWGEFVDLSNGGDDSPGVRWLVGEDLTIIGGAIRDMKNPPTFGDPDRMTSIDYWTSSGDSGGVHINSGINNKAAYLITDGDTFNGYTVTGLGIAKTAKIFYEAQANLLTSGADYADLYDYLYQACLNLVDSNGIVAADCDEVRAATDAVEMNLDPNGDPGFSPEASLCPDGQVQGAIHFADDFEINPLWQPATLSGTENPWYRIEGYATSGLYSLINFDIDTMADAVVWNTLPVALSGSAYLHFRHAYGFEAGRRDYYDGGVLEYRTNDTDWLDLGPMFDDGQPYAGTIYAGTQGQPSANPLGGRSGFVGESHGYVSSRYDLSALAGQDFQVRFRAASDSSVGGPLGWVVDDVMIYACEPESNSLPNTPYAPNPGDAADAVPVSITLSWTGGDPDGDPVTYDVWLAAGDATPDVLVCEDVSVAGCDPVGDFAYDTTYYWRVEARDSHGATSTGAVWVFTTESGPDVTCSGEDVLIQNRVFDTDTTCVADFTLTANSSVVVRAGAKVTFESPSTTLGSNFSVEAGAGFSVRTNN